MTEIASRPQYQPPVNELSPSQTSFTPVEDVNRAIGRWLLFVCTLILILIIFGGWVRLTRSGLSIVEWNVITGVIPPLNETDWQNEFDKYKQSPEYEKINFNMPLDEFKFIYHMEFWHRFLGRIAGLSYVLPLLYFLRKGGIPRAQLPVYVIIGLLFALQGLIGWLMVKSGLEDRPSVSHIRLTLHLSGALLLLATCLWQAFKNLIPHERKADSTPLALPSVLFFAALYIQIAAGGLLAGLKAGYISNTFPLMFGQLIPDGLFNLAPAWINLLDSSPMVHFQHRWFAFVVLGLAIWLYIRGRATHVAPLLRISTTAVMGITLLQVLLGIATVLGGMPIALASLHQATAVALFGAGLMSCYCATSS